MRRRSFLAALSALAASGEAARLAHAAPLRYPDVLPGARLLFPRDYGAHADFRIEWWYITGWLDARKEEPRGFQITFFRARAPEDTSNPSRFAARQIIFAHAALGDPRLGRLLHEERAARAALDLAGAAEARTEAWLDDWRLEQTERGYRASIAAREFGLALDFDAAGEVMLQGEAGVSRKGPRPREASYYYSQPQMPVRGEIVQAGARTQVSGKAWLDHEWSSSYLAPEAAGWDWTGINLADGGALMLFRMRARRANAAGGVYYAGGTLRSADGRLRRFAPREIRFEPLRSWRSPRTGVEYPVAMRIVAGDLEWRLEPLMDDQELDARASTGTIYWEGAVRAFSNDAEVGRGYLELTGYWRAMKL